VGLKRRWPDGRKDCYQGSRLGLLLPQWELPGSRFLLIVEGESDLAAALTLGFEAVGLPGVHACWDVLAETVRGLSVVLILDNDEPGQRASADLVCHLASVCRSIRQLVPDAKDLREWLNNGLTAELLAERIEATQPVRVVAAKIRWSYRHGR